MMVHLGRFNGRPLLGVCLIVCGLFLVNVASAELTVLSVEPTPDSITAQVNDPIVVHFDRPVKSETVTCNQAFWAFGKWSGPIYGTHRFSNGHRTVSLVPDRPLSAGEPVLVILSRQIRATDGTFLRFGGYSFQYWVASAPSSMNFTQIQLLSTNIGPKESSRPYGGHGADLNGDGFLDLSVVNEDSSDVRIYMNQGDCFGTMAPMSMPTTPVGVNASPSESADFNKDGIIDLCVSNTASNTVSVLLGVGDGTFLPHQEIPVGVTPRGIAVLDSDGDGDMDFVNTNYTSDDLCLHLNNGAGVFGVPVHFDSGITNEWALATADMNQDGLLDLVVGSLTTGEVIVNFSLGNGGFMAGPAHDGGGEVWVLVCGDVNNDGNSDVAIANGQSDTGSIVLNNGYGFLLEPTIYQIDPFAPSSDLGDLDGDGDLDWVTSSFLGDWTIHENDGAGNFTVLDEIQSPQAASCAILFDHDNDGDLDMALVDEMADVILIMRNDGVDEDCNMNSIPDACDLIYETSFDCNGNGILDDCDVPVFEILDESIPPECATPLAQCAQGSVNAACERTDVLAVNGQTGFTPRTLTVGIGDPLSFTIDEPPSRRCDNSTTRACIYAWARVPTVSDILVLPLQLGDMCFGPAYIATRPPKQTWNGIGRVDKLGEDDGPGNPPIISDGGSFEFLSISEGWDEPIMATIQGIVEDNCSTASIPYSVTNGITVFIQ